MPKLRLVLPFLLLAALIPAAANAGPAPISVSFSSNAQYVSPTTILLEATVNCDPALPVAYVYANVLESETGGRGYGSFSFTCTGDAQHIVVPVDGAGFAPGHAYVSGGGCAYTNAAPFVGFCDTSERQVQITL